MRNNTRNIRGAYCAGAGHPTSRVSHRVPILTLAANTIYYYGVHADI